MEEKFKIKPKLIGIAGCMFAGKSTAIVKQYIEEKKQGKTIEAFKPISNKRGGENIVSRDMPETPIPCKCVMDITEALETKADVVFIDEMQNFNAEQFKHTLKEFKKTDKTVYVAGLHKNGVNQYWENYTILEKLADRVDLIKVKCQLCSCNADFSCLTKFGEAKSFSTTKGAEYMNLCDACSIGKNVLEIGK